MSAVKLDRRDFVRGGMCLCGLCACGGLGSLAFAGDGSSKDEKLDPKKLKYCGYTCPEDCKFLQGTLKNDDALKREAFKLWKLEERFGISYDPATAICYGCKAPGKPEGEVVSRCDVRACAQEKKVDCCIECGELEACDKDLWRRFPKFKEQVIAAQKRYQAQA